MCGSTALHLACAVGNIEAVQVLLNNGADVGVLDSQGLSAAAVALSAGRVDVHSLITPYTVDMKERTETGEVTAQLIARVNRSGDSIIDMGGTKVSFFFVVVTILLSPSFQLRSHILIIITVAWLFIYKCYLEILSADMFELLKSH